MNKKEKLTDNELINMANQIIGLGLTIDRENLTVTLPQTDNRDVYKKIEFIIKRLGGKYVTGKKHFSFQVDPLPLIEEYLNLGELPQNNPTAFYPTPKFLGEDMLFESTFNDRIENLPKDMQEKKRVLEPSAGVGGLADLILQKAPYVQLDTVEIFEPNQNILKAKGYNPYCMDFLNFNTDFSIKYDFIIMNPPFMGQLYIKHIKHAFKMLKDDGVLCAIGPTSFLREDNKLNEELCELIALYGGFIENPENSFIDTGTSIDTATIILNKDYLNWKSKPKERFVNFYVWNVFLTLLHDGKLYNYIQNNYSKKSFKENYFEEIQNRILLSLEYAKKEQDLLFPKKYLFDYAAEYICYLLEGDEKERFSFMKRPSLNDEVIFTPSENKKLIENDYIEDISIPKEENTDCPYSNDQMSVFETGFLF